MSSKHYLNNYINQRAKFPTLKVQRVMTGVMQSTFQRQKKDLGWQPTVGFEEGNAQTINWYLKNQD